ncbi:MAG: hypothetical protein CSA25_06540 [Desulfobacter postgatei]|uniref:Uncharacterized protein n=1 Tax=Desulfobacter postgatei TaxID=2293 RepID=A0A2G6MPY1_9BACT|nr:MAG: hypothetical protein CSA25_06540 [Desulfobacter postgatei]
MKVGDRLPTFKIVDQFDKEHVLSADANTIIVTSSRGTSEIIRDYLLAQEKDFLEKNRAYYVADISGMPSFIAKFFAIPKMKDCPFSILLVDEEQTKSFSKKNDQITIYTIENAKVSSVNYLKTKEELSNFFK